MAAPKFTDLTAAAQTAFAGLSQATRQAELTRSIADVPGGFASKHIGGRLYFDLDFLTARHRRGDAPVAVAQLGIMLQPLRFMEYSLEATLPLVLPASAGPILVNVPQPQRYALAKLLVHVERSRSAPTEARKDLEQAASLIDYFSRSDPAALLDAWDDLVGRGPAWRKQAAAGLAALAAQHPGIACCLPAPPPGRATPAPAR